MIHNTQPIERQSDSALLDVHSIFYTIQGEGPFCGTPAIFIRLAGCNLQCPACDTDYTSRRRHLAPNELVTMMTYTAADYLANEFDHNGQSYRDRTIDVSRKYRGLVVITGGEPFRQGAALATLIDLLLKNGCYVQVETNGVLGPPGILSSKDVSQRKGFYIVVSPKTGKINAQTAKQACAFKYVMNAGSVDPRDGLPINALHNAVGIQLARPPDSYSGPIYLQPQDDYNIDGNKANLRACIESCMRHGYVLQLQVHKILDME